MSGELWRSVAQVGREANYGIAVPSTRKMYLTNPGFTLTQAPRPHSFATGDRQGMRGFSHGPKQVAGTFTVPLSAEESLEWLLMALDGYVTPTTPAGFTDGRLWTFKPGANVASATCEYHDGAIPWIASGVMVDQLTFAGSVGAENTMSGTLFAADQVQGSLTAGLADRIPTWLEGWETRVYIDPIGDPPGTTIIPGQVLSWNAQLSNALGRKYFADNTLRTGAVVQGQLGVTGSLALEASGPQAIAEFNHWNATDLRVVRLEFGNNAVIDVGTNEVQTVTITGTPTGGTFTLTFQGATTSAIAYNATAATVLAALTALANIAHGGVAVTGSAGGPYTVTFQGALGGRNVPSLVAAGSLTGGTSPSVDVATATPGVGSRRSITIDIPGAWSAVNLGGNDAGTRTYDLSLQGLYSPTLAAMFQVQCFTDRAVGFS